MFVDFDKVFSNTPQTDMRIPKVLADQLSSDLPEGLRYVVDEETNNLTITVCDESKKDYDITVSGLIFTPTDEQKVVLGENYSFDDLMQLSYNSQKPVPFVLNDSKCVRINGKEIPVERLIEYNPLKPDELIISKMCMIPSTFPKGFSIKIGNNEVALNLSVRRIPNNSVNVFAFESDQTKCLSIKYFIDSKNSSLSLTINISIKNATTVKEIIDSIKIYNLFVEGKGCMNNVPIHSKLITENISMFDGSILEYWNKVYMLEMKLGTSFMPPFTDLSYDCVYLIEELYQNIINLTPIREDRRITSITSKWDFSKEHAITDSLGKPVYFEADGNTEVELFGQKLIIPCLMGIFNAIFTKCEKNDLSGECTIYFEDASEEKRMYVSTLHFVDTESMNEYRKDINDVNNRIIPFRDAKRIKEYLT